MIALRIPRTAAALLGVVLLGAGCTLAEVTTPEAEDVLVVEAILNASAPTQRILLHRSLTEEGQRGEPGAQVSVFAPGGREISFAEVNPTACLPGGEIQSPGEPGPLPGNSFSCYASPSDAAGFVVPGEGYDLEVLTRAGERARARTRVPGAFALRQPSQDAARACSLPPDTPLPLVWTRAEGAWSYLAELSITGLASALPAAAGSAIPDTVRLTGLSISESDTTMVLPGDFGIFQRTEFDSSLLLRISRGLPEGVAARLVLAAVDRNYVNGVRGGVFNPSGRVRISSVRGNGVGVFGSLVPLTLLIDVRREGSPYPPCLEG